MNRRGFLASCIALASAPAIVRADSLMRIVPREAVLLIPARMNDATLEMLIHSQRLIEGQIGHLTGMRIMQGGGGDRVIFRRPVPFRVGVDSVILLPSQQWADAMGPELLGERITVETEGRS